MKNYLKTFYISNQIFSVYRFLRKHSIRVQLLAPPRIPWLKIFQMVLQNEIKAIHTEGSGEKLREFTWMDRINRMKKEEVLP